MTDEITRAIATEVAKQIPVKEAYQDILHPGAQSTGIIVEDLVKTLHLALAPIQFTAAVQDRFRNFLDTAIRRVPEKSRIAPAPQILGPVIEGIKYEPEDSPIEKMFSELLSRSVDRDRVAEAHPAFPYLIKQLSPDEANILRQIHDGRRGAYTKTSRYRFQEGRSLLEQVEEDTFPRSYLTFSHNMEFYMNHLWFLGLAGTFEVRQEPVNEGGRQVGSREFREYRFTDLGEMFAHAVLPATRV